MQKTYRYTDASGQPSTFVFQFGGTVTAPTKKQLASVAFHLNNPRSFNFNDLGLGKTLTALAVADNIMLRNPGWKTLILANLSLLEDVWVNHIATHMRKRGKYAVVEGSGKLRALDKDVNYYVANHDAIKSGALFAHGRLYVNDFSQALYKRLKEDIKIIIIDEASAYRVSTAQRSRIFRAMAARAEYVLMMTATPRPNSAMDAHGLRRAIDPAWNTSMEAWRDLTMRRITDTRYEDIPEANDLCNELLQPSICFLREEGDLPACWPQFRKHTLNKEQEKAYAKVKREAVVEINSESFTVQHEAAIRTKMLQICCGEVYDNERNVWSFANNNRLSLLLETMHTYPGKFIIYAPYRSAIDAIYKFLGKSKNVHGKPFSVAKVTGATSLAERSAMFASFSQNVGGYDTLLADPTPVARGLTFLACKTIIWFAPTDKSEIWSHANARHHRTGQTDETYVCMLYSTPLEKQIYERKQQNKKIEGELRTMLAEEKTI
jgi:SNF2 family DNA or RNA helicase